MSVTAYPLSWPAGWPKNTDRWHPRHPFKNNTFSRARESLAVELERLGAQDIILSTNVPLRIDGQPRGDYQDRLPDPGVAVYFTLRGRPMVMARDAFYLVSDNLRSLAMAVEHLRGLERHGGGQMVDRAFTGFAALPAPDRVAPWREVFGLAPGQNVSSLGLQELFRQLAKQRHPDMQGGSESLMIELNRAMDDASRELEPAQPAARATA